MTEYYNVVCCFTKEVWKYKHQSTCSYQSEKVLLVLFISSGLALLLIKEYRPYA
jgi:hypothetical protein